MDKVNLLFYDTSDSSEIFLFKIKDSRFSNQYFSIRVRKKKKKQRTTADLLQNHEQHRGCGSFDADIMF